MPPILWAISNHVDKYLYERFYRDAKPGSMMLFTAILAAILSVGLFVFASDGPEPSTVGKLTLFAPESSRLQYIFPYIFAMLRDEASRVAPLFQISPFFTTVLGWVLLHEHLEATEIVGGIVITFGAIGLSADLANGFRVRRDVLLLMVVAALLFSVEVFLFKLEARDLDLWHAMAYQYAGCATAGAVIAIARPAYRESFMRIIRENRRVVFTVSLLNESAVTAALLLFNWAALLAPLALVSFVSNTQPFMTIAIGVLLTRFAPTLGKEDISRDHLGQKVACRRDFPYVGRLPVSDAILHF